MSACFHCGLPALDQYAATVDGSVRAFCCLGCQAVARAIAEGGLADFYRFRDQPCDKVQSARAQYQAFDLPEVKAGFVKLKQDGTCEAMLTISGITCAACAWLIENRLQQVPGVLSVRVNATNYLCAVTWQGEDVRPSQIFTALAEVGYRAQPYSASLENEQRQSHQKRMIMRLGLAGIGMMQVGMFAIVLHAGAIQGIDSFWQHFFRWVSLLVATPVVLFSAQPFFTGAARALSSHHLSMDVPVALAIGLAYVASVWATVGNVGEVYFDSISMFTFFLLLGRFLELKVRNSSAFFSERLSRLLPLTVLKQVDQGSDGPEGGQAQAEGQAEGAEGGQAQEAGPQDTKNTGKNTGQAWQSIPLGALKVGDRVRVAAGEVIPCDGRVLAGSSAVNESLLSGEALPQLKSEGDAVWAGTLVGDTALTVEVRALGDASRLASIERLVCTAMLEKPRQVAMADRLAGKFVAAVLLVSMAVAAYWLQAEPDKALWVVLSVLVATCPCALSLATPAALTAGTLHMRRQGLLVTSSAFIEKLNAVDWIVFDKTGTLTCGELGLAELRLLPGSLRRFAAGGEEHNRQACERHLLNVIAALESHTAHPIATAFAHIASPWRAEELRVEAGRGVEGLVDGHRYRFGQASFSAPGQTLDYPGEGLWQLLSCDKEPLAWVCLQDSPRAGLAPLLAQLRRQGLGCELLSGDRAVNAERFASAFEFDRVSGGCSPEHKLARIKQLRQQGRRVLMVGDGINDVPVLSGAFASVAMGASTRLAQTHADAILLNENLQSLAQALTLAGRTRSIIRQNMLWALAYNSLILPFAAAGWVPPYVAAIGMSASSLLVVLNALRLKNAGPDSASNDRGTARPALAGRSY